MARNLSNASLVPVTLGACTVLLGKYRGHCLYQLHETKKSGKRLLMIAPQYKTSRLPPSSTQEDRAQIKKWLGPRGFRAFMLPRQRARFADPCVDAEGGKLVVRSGKKRITPLYLLLV